MTQPGTLVNTYAVTDVYARVYDLYNRNTAVKRVGLFEPGQLALVIAVDKTTSGTWYCIITSLDLWGWVLAHWCEVVL